MGGSVTLPLLPKRIELTRNVLAGYGVGRYGSGQLPDATLKASGAPSPLPEVIAMVGLVGHPPSSVDIYGYLGAEQINQKTIGVNGTGSGYGSSNAANSGCQIELSTVCHAQTQSLTGGVVGGWWRFLSGNFGTMMFGGQ